MQLMLCETKESFNVIPKDSNPKQIDKKETRD